MKNLPLQILENGFSTGLSVRYGGFLAEAASVCLNHYKHPIDITFPVEGTIKETYLLSRLNTDELSVTSFSDLQEAVEFGAMGIAILLLHELTKYKFIRSYKGTGFDFWVGEYQNDFAFQNKLRLEVSGDLEGTDSQLKQRLNTKLAQTARSADLKLMAYAIIVEFSNPKTLTGSI